MNAVLVIWVLLGMGRPTYEAPPVVIEFKTLEHCDIARAKIINESRGVITGICLARPA